MDLSTSQIRQSEHFSGIAEKDCLVECSSFEVPLDKRAAGHELLNSQTHNDNALEPSELVSFKMGSLTEADSDEALEPSQLVCVKMEAQSEDEVENSDYVDTTDNSNSAQVEKSTPAVKSFKCTKCSLEFNTRGKLKFHREQHKDSKVRSCDICNKTFSSKTSLLKHKEQVHIAIRSHVCNTCKLTFVSKGDLKQHENGVHARLRPYVCTHCDMGFSKRSNFLRHQTNVHLGLKPFSCDICKKTFAQKGYIRIHHNLVHADGKP